MKLWYLTLNPTKNDATETRENYKKKNLIGNTPQAVMLTGYLQYLDILSHAFGFAFRFVLF